MTIPPPPRQQSGFQPSPVEAVRPVAPEPARIPDPNLPTMRDVERLAESLDQIDQTLAELDQPVR